jgi:hypothetical protein
MLKRGDLVQILVVFQKDTRQVIATFEMNTFITEANVLVIPGVSYLITFKRDIFYTGKDKKLYVKEV